MKTFFSPSQVETTNRFLCQTREEADKRRIFFWRLLVVNEMEGNEPGKICICRLSKGREHIWLFTARLCAASRSISEKSGASVKQIQRELAGAETRRDCQVFRRSPKKSCERDVWSLLHNSLLMREDGASLVQTLGLQSLGFKMEVFRIFSTKRTNYSTCYNILYYILNII